MPRRCGVPDGGNILRFPRKRRRHARTSSRAASAISASALRPAVLAALVLNTADHHSAGMLSRCHHLLTAEPFAPMSDAIASREGQSSITAWKDAILGMGDTLGQSVLDCKVNLSCDLPDAGTQNLPVSKDPTKTAFKEQFARRVRWARLAHGTTQAELADLLGMAQDTYKQYETRSYLPHDVVPKFCKITKVDPTWLYTGKGVAPAGAEPTEEPARRGRRLAGKERAA
jgi:DNA-binding XRE family transcriptional regulator